MLNHRAIVEVINMGSNFLRKRKVDQYSGIRRAFEKDCGEYFFNGSIMINHLCSNPFRNGNLKESSSKGGSFPLYQAAF